MSIPRWARTIPTVISRTASRWPKPRTKHRRSREAPPTAARRPCSPTITRVWCRRSVCWRWKSSSADSERQRHGAIRPDTAPYRRSRLDLTVPVRDRFRARPAGRAGRTRNSNRGNSLMSWHLRPATAADSAQIEELIGRSIRALGAADYSAEQIEGALEGAFGLDSQLIADGTYFVVESEGDLVGCGGWSYRRTLFGGDARQGRDAGAL